MTDDDVLLRHLRFRQYTVLALLALLAIFTFLLQEMVAFSYSSGGAVINISGRQRMLSVRATVLATLLSTRHDHEDKTAWRNLLQETLSQIDSSHNDLLKGNPERNLPGNPSLAVQRLLFGPDEQISARIERFTSLGREVLTLEEQQKLTQDTPQLVEMGRMAVGDYIQALDRLVDQYQMESEQQVATLRRVYISALTLTLLVLTFVAIGIFRPMLQRLRTDFYHREQKKRELQEAMERVDRANRAKSEFLSGMSHELRTPMNAVMGYSDLLLTDDNDPLSAEQKDSVREIVKGGNYLLHLINEVLDLARIEAGRIHLEMSAFPLSDAVSDTLSLVQSLAEKREITIDSQVDSTELPLIYGDAVRTKQVVLNLVSNAIKYNRPGGQVVLRAKLESDGTQVRLEVRDQGAGIPEEKRCELFTPFNRLGAEKAGIEGTGIGLSIAKQLVEAMGGAIGYRPNSDVGSCFWITLPKNEEQKRA